jgi:hypothetical protein
VRFAIILDSIYIAECIDALCLEVVCKGSVLKNSRDFGCVSGGHSSTKIQDQHSAQRNNSCENPMHGAYIIFDESLGKLEANGCRGEELDWCL